MGDLKGLCINSQNELLKTIMLRFQVKSADKVMNLLSAKVSVNTCAAGHLQTFGAFDLSSQRMPLLSRS